MLSAVWLAAWLALPAAQPANPLQAVFLSHEGDDALGVAFVGELKILLQERGVRLAQSRSPDSHTLVMLSIRAVSERTSQQMGSVVAMALLRPDDRFVKLWVYTLNHTPGHVRTQAADLVSDMERIKAER
jgi:hypothetical protein